MRKTIVILSLIFLFVSQVSSAETRVGIGWQNGCSMIIDMSTVSVQSVVDFSRTKPKNGDSSTNISASGYIALSIFKVENAHFKAFGGGNIKLYFYPKSSREKETDFAIRAGLMPEIMVSRNVGLSGRMGISISINRGYKGYDDTSYTIGSFGDVGVHWYF